MIQCSKAAYQSQRPRLHEFGLCLSLDTARLGGDLSSGLDPALRGFESLGVLGMGIGIGIWDRETSTIPCWA